MRLIVRIAAVLLGLVALTHVARLIFHVNVMVGGYPVPLWVSAAAALLAGVVAVMLWREDRRD